MPEKTLTVAAYAAGASLAAITLIYVFGPTYFLENDGSAGPNAFLTAGSRKKGVVGLSNPANDCFINSVLQALAGLGDLRLYLIREIHRRSLDEASVYSRAVPPELAGEKGSGMNGMHRNMPEWKIEGLQSGIVTKGLKDMLDSLNERPIYRKVITAGPFVKTLEIAFRQRISRQQQDAQEFLQVVAERLCDEYHAGRRARDFAKRNEANGAATPLNGRLVGAKLNSLDSEPAAPLATIHASPVDLDAATSADSDKNEREEETVEKEGEREEVGEREVRRGAEEEEGFPMEGKYESQIECLTCGFKPRPTESTFCTLTLNVPQTSSTSLSACFDGMFKTEYIDDFKCEKCRLVHAISILESEASKSTSPSHQESTMEAIRKLQEAVEADPEHPPAGIDLPDLRQAPKRRIARHIRLTEFPKILAIHLSRSIYDSSNMSQKNSAKVSFPEQLPLGGLLHQRKYKLLGLVTHKGSHHSGHYESFRRQNLYPPYPNLNTFQASGVYSRTASPASTPQLASTPQMRAVRETPEHGSPLTSTPDLLAAAESGNDSSTPSLESTLSPRSAHRAPQTSAPRERDIETSSLKSVAVSARSTLSKLASSPSSRAGSRKGTTLGGSPPSSSATVTALGPRGPQPNHAPALKRRRHPERWWRISDEKLKEASTRDVLGMQREVYLLFYELDKTVS